MTDIIYTCTNYVRILIDDTDSSDYEYSDKRLSDLIIMSCSYVNNDTDSKYTVDLCSKTVSPDPDSNFINLVALKSVCLLASAQYSRNARTGDVKVNDGVTSVDLKGLSSGLKDFSKTACENYARELNNYLLGRDIRGVIVTTPNSES